MPQIVQGSVEPNDRRIIYLTFDAPLPSPADVMRAAYWELVVTTAEGAARASVDGAAIKTCSTLVAAHGFLNRCPPGESIVEIALQLPRPIPDPVRQVDVLYVGPSGTTSIAIRGAFELALGRAAGAPLAPANIDEADIYFDGKYTRVVDEEAAFDIDAYAGYMRALAPGSARYWGRAGFYGQMRAKDSPSDPDSLLLYGAYQRVVGSGAFYGPFQTPVFSLRAPGIEIERRGDQRNFIVSPLLTVPLRLSRGALGPIQPGIVYPQMMLFAGAEVVKPLATRDDGADGWRMRTLLGATLTTGIAPEQAWLQSLTLRASYQVRLLSSPEIFKDPRGSGVFEFDSQPRHRTEVSFSYFPVKWTGLSFEYEYGGVPPIFFLAGHTFTAGITFTLKQTSYGRLAILAP